MLIGNKDIPYEALLVAADAKAAWQRDLARSQLKLSQMCLEAKEKCEKEVRASIGAGERVKAYEKIRATKKQRLRDLARTTRHNPEGLKIASQKRQQILTEADQAVGRLGIDTRKIKEIRRRYIGDVSSFEIVPGLRFGQEGPFVPLDLDVKPSPLDRPGGSTWVDESPPYDDQWGDAEKSCSRGNIEAFDLEDNLHGRLKNEITIHVSDTDDFDFALVNVHSEFQFWHLMSATGPIEILAILDPPVSCTNYSGYLLDEWGFSDASVWESSAVYFTTYANGTADRPPQTCSPDWNYIFNITAPAEGNWGGIKDQMLFANLFSKDSYQSGQYVLCGLGFWDHVYMLLNDMTCWTNVTSQWRIPHIFARTGL